MVVHSRYPVGEPRVEREARAAVAAGYDVQVVCLGSGGEPPVETRDGVGIVRIPIEHVRGAGARRMLFEYGGFTLAAAARVAALHRRARLDAVYVHAPPDFLILSALLPRLRGAGVVLDIHDLSPDMFEARFAGSSLAAAAERALRAVELRACRLADRVVTVHEQYRDELVQHGVPRQKISVVMNSPDERALEHAKAARRDRE